jgi:diaminohydroxyphosphoribosylaminopyrimidine deaminase/5-amino-6-(5-phosphoribosylamino)uracil reductase
VVTATSLKSPKARKLQNAGVELLQQKSGKGRINLTDVLRELGRRNILSVLLEAGPQLNRSALARGMARKLVLFYAPKLAGRCIVPFAAPAALKHAHIESVRHFGPDVALYVTLDY